MVYNHLYVLLQLYPDKISWDNWDLSINEGITWEIIKEFIHKPWNWRGISCNSNITWDIIRQNMNYPWQYGLFNYNPNITFDIIEKNPLFPWNYRLYSSNPSLDLNTMNKKPGLWSIEGLCFNPNIPFNSLFLDDGDEYYDWEGLSTSDVEWSVIEKYINKPWDWELLSCKPNITWDIIKGNLDKPWSWAMISCNPNITWDIIKNNPDKQWNWRMVSCNPNITWDIVKNNPNKSWDWEMLSRNPNITWKIIKDNIHKPWDWRIICSNKFDIYNSATIIQRWWKKMKYNIYKKQHRTKYVYVLLDIVLLPGIGLEYQESRDRFNYSNYKIK